MKTKKAFTLIEIALVLATISILILGVIQGSKLLDKSRLVNARKLTDQSPVYSTANLVLWLESTSIDRIVNSSNSMEVRDGDSVQFWRNMVDELSSNNASQSIATNQPIYKTNIVNGLPILRFDGSSDFLNLPDGTVPYDNSSYSVFFIARVADLSVSRSLLGSGTYSTTNATNVFRYSTAGNLINYWWGVDISSPANSVIADRFYIIYYTYTGSTRSIYVNGISVAGPTAATNRASTAINNTIGVANTNEYMSGDIGEIIVFNRSLKTEERKNIEQYLSRKWGIGL